MAAQIRANHRPLHLPADRIASCKGIGIIKRQKGPGTFFIPGFQEVRSSISRSPRIASATSNNVNSGKVPGTFSVLSISLLFPQASVQTKKRFLTPFLFSMQNMQNQSTLCIDPCLLLGNP